jgi:transposase-like protein
MNMLEVASMTEDQARAYLEELRWPNGPVCPNCEKQNVTRMQGKAHRKGLFQCNNLECRQQFTVKCNSVLESSKVSLKKWVLAFHLLCTSKKGFSALQLQRELSLGSYRTAWFMLHRIRYAMAVNSFEKPLDGVIEMDECYVGGKPRNRQKGKPGRPTNKQPVVALVQRDGCAISRPVDSVNIATLRGEANKHVDKSAIICTDQLHSYRHLEHERRSVNHTRQEYVRKEADGFLTHTNTVESYFALLKRGHYGVYHTLSKKHLPLYCGEFSFRWNHRQVSDTERREAAYKKAPGKRLKYKTSGKKTA